jgi:DNA-binding transcriptional LysR family regulator
LTDAGRRLLPLALDILERVDSAVESMVDITALKTGRVTIASATVLAATYLPSRIASFMRIHPEIRVDLRDVSEDEIRTLLLNGEADIGVGTSRFREQEINEHELFADHLALFCPADDPLAQRKAVDWADFDNRSFIALTSENPLQRRIDQLLEVNGVATRRQFSVRFSATLLALVNEGLGIGILPAGSKGLSPMVNIVMRPITDQVASRNVVALTLRERTLSPAAQSFFLHITS